MTTIAAVLQCVERGKLRLDDDVAGKLPALANAEILKGFDEAGQAILAKRKKTLTLR